MVTTPDRDKVVLKGKFEERLRGILKDRYDDFIKYSFTFPRRCMRVNTLKMPVEELKQRLNATWNLTPVPWCREGFWIEHKEGERRDIGNLIEHSLGYIYVQEPASMLPAIALGPMPGEVVLDMCAAPGSKATQMAAMMENTGLLVANDHQGKRIRPLAMNIQRAGIMNTIITLMEGYLIKDIQFDRVLVDAPCSGTGTIRKSLKTVEMWNPQMIKRLEATQKHLASTAYGLLKEGGSMVYSTCSVEPEEDEEVVDYLLSKFPDASLLNIDLDIKRSEPILEFQGKKYNEDIKKCLRIWPQDNNTDGFFVARIRKGIKKV